MKVNEFEDLEPGVRPSKTVAKIDENRISSWKRKTKNETTELEPNDRENH